MRGASIWVLCCLIAAAGLIALANLNDPAWSSFVMPALGGLFVLALIVRVIRSTGGAARTRKAAEPAVVTAELWEELYLGRKHGDPIRFGNESGTVAEAQTPIQDPLAGLEWKPAAARK